MNTASLSSTAFGQRLHGRTLAMGGAAAVVILGVAYGVLTIVDRSQHELIRKELRSVLGIAHTSCHRYLDRQQALNTAFAQRPQFASGFRSGLRGENPDDLKERVDDLLPTIGMAGWALLDVEGRVRLAGGSCESWAEAPIPLRAKLKDVLRGEDALLPPRLVPAAGGGEQAFILAASRILDGDKAVGVLAMTVDPAITISGALAEARYGETGETYVVDMDGRLCSRSRYLDDLEKADLVPHNARNAIGRLRIARPPIPLAKGKPEGNPSSWPLTTAVSEVVSGNPGLDLDNAWDYRGERVVSAWVVCPDHQVGLVTQIDYDEAFATLHFLRVVFGGLVLLLAVAAGMGVLWAVRAQRMRYQWAKAEKHLQQLGQYQLVRKLGEGGMGTVYLANHALLRRQTAVKLISGTVTPETIARFEREVRLSCQLTHPNAIAVYDFGRTAEGTFYYAMEYLEGMDLDTMVALGGPLPPARVIHFLQQACGSLAEAHRMKMIHRDIKPGNLFVTCRGGIPDFLKVLDFGLAKSTDQRATKLSMENIVCGTPGYLAPESMQGLELDGRSDLYSLACVAYFLLTAQRVFERETVMEMVMAHVQTDPVPISKVAKQPIPGDLELTVMRCLDKNPDERPTSALELRSQLLLCADAGKWTDAEAEAWWAQEAPKLMEQKRQQGRSDAPGSSQGEDLPTLLIDGRKTR